jgi:general stress protein 26
VALDAKELDDLLNNEDIVFIASTKPNGDPHLVPLWFVSLDGVIYFQTSSSTQLYKNIEHRNKIVLCFGGKDTYLLKGHVAKWHYQEAPIDWKTSLERKYKDFNIDEYLDDTTYIYEVTPDRELSWHYTQ